MTTPIYPPIPTTESGPPAPSVTVVEQTNIIQIGEFQLEISIDSINPLSRTISMSLKDSADELITGIEVAGLAWVILDDGSGFPEGTDIFKRSPICPDYPGGSQWDLAFVDGLATMRIDRAAYAIDFYFAVQVLGVVTLYSFNIGS